MMPVIQQAQESKKGNCFLAFLSAFKSLTQSTLHTKPRSFLEDQLCLMERFHQSKASRPHGIGNIGQACYLDATLQALFATPSFVKNYIMSYRGKKDDTPLGSALYATLSSYLSDHTDTSPLSDALATKDASFARYKQYDASCVLSAIFSQLRAESPRDKIDLARRVFGFETACSTRCDACTSILWNFQSSCMLYLNLDEPNAKAAAPRPCLQQRQRIISMMLKAPAYELIQKYSVPSKIHTTRVDSIQSAMDFTFQPYRVFGFLCRTCGREGAVDQEQFIFNAAPQCLILNPKRFSLEPGNIHKDSRLLPNEEIIDVANYVLAHDQKSVHSKYVLYAVVVHAGNLDGGHYYTYVKRGNEWYEANDSYVRKVDYRKDVRNACASLLFYEEAGAWMKRMLKIMELKIQHDI